MSGHPAHPPFSIFGRVRMMTAASFMIRSEIKNGGRIILLLPLRIFRMQMKSDTYKPVMKSFSRNSLVLLFVLLLKFILQYRLTDRVYDLHRDEYLHLDLGGHLAWGYLSVPPVTGVISALIHALGGTVFWVKFFPALFGALTIFLVWKTIETLGGDLFACVLGAVCLLFSSLLRMNLLYQPNSLDILCWTALFYTILLYIRSERPRYLYAAAVVFALGFLNKYNICFLAAGFVPALLLTPQRKLFLKKETALAALLVLLLIMPNIIWQVRHHFPVVHHMRELAGTQLVHVERTEFLEHQLLFFTGALFVIVAGLVALIRYSAFRPYRSFAYVMLFVLAAFTYLRAKDYYAVGLYPVYIGFGSVYLSAMLKEGWKRFLKPMALLIPLLLFIPVYRIGFPDKQPVHFIQHPDAYRKFGLLKWEDGREHALPQDFADMLGWKELGRLTDSIFSSLPDSENTLVLCDNYGEAGAVNFYKKNSRLQALSFNADYLYWFRYDRPYRNVILVKEKEDEDPGRRTERPFFDTVYLAARRVNGFAREDSIHIYVLKGARIDVNGRIKEEAERKMNEW